MTDAEQWLRFNGLDQIIDYMHVDRWLRSRTINSIVLSSTKRSEFIRKFGFAVLIESTIKKLKPYGPILEVGAGSGYWASELTKAGIDILATDSYTEPKYGFIHGQHFTVKKMNATKAAKQHPDRALLFVWPSYNRKWPVTALRAYKGSTVLYVGEGKGGCTADYPFHDYLERYFELRETVVLPQFDGLHDKLTIWRRT